MESQRSSTNGSNTTRNSMKKRKHPASLVVVDGLVSDRCRRSVVVPVVPSNNNSNAATNAENNKRSRIPYCQRDHLNSEQGNSENTDTFSTSAQEVSSTSTIPGSATSTGSGSISSTVPDNMLELRVLNLMMHSPGNKIENVLTKEASVHSVNDGIVRHDTQPLSPNRSTMSNNESGIWNENESNLSFICSSDDPQHQTELFHADFDEGMNQFIDTAAAISLSDDNTIDRTIRKSILLYNVGLTHCNTSTSNGKRQFPSATLVRTYINAEKWFRMSYQSLESVSDCDDSSIVNNKEEHSTNDREKCIVRFKILRCLGYCIYRQCRFDDAYNTFLEALQCINDITNSDSSTTDSTVEILYHIASIKNAMAISKFHSKNTSNMGMVLELLHESLDIYTDVSLPASTEYNRGKEIATSLNNIGRVYFTVRGYNKARTVFEASLKMRRHLYKNDPNPVEIKVTICNLAQTYHQLRMFDDAIRFYHEFLHLEQQQQQQLHQYCPHHRPVVNTASHRDIAIVCTRIGNIYADREDFSIAKKMYECALKSIRILQQYYRTTSASVATNQHRRRNLTELVSILNKLGTVCHRMGELQVALQYMQEGYDIENLLYTGSSSNKPTNTTSNRTRVTNSIITLMNIAQIHRELNDFKSAFVVYNQIYKVQIKELPKDATDATTTTTTIGSDQQSTTVEISTTLFNMGLMMHRLKSYEQAFTYYQEALLLQRQRVDEDTVDIAATLNSIGIVLFHLGQRDTAKEYFEQSLILRRKFLGQYHPDIPVTLFNLAMVYLESGDEDTASTMLLETLRIERIVLGPDCYESVQTLQHLGLTYQLKGELDEALQYFQAALHIERIYNGNFHVVIGKLLNSMGNIYLQLGDVPRMMECYTEASRINAIHKEPLAIAGYNLYCISKLHPECAKVA